MIRRFLASAVANPGFGPIGGADFLEHFHHGFVGPAVQRTLERADRRGDRRVHVGKRRGDDAGGERRGVVFVLGVQNERHVHRLGQPLGGRLSNSIHRILPASDSLGS